VRAADVVAGAGAAAVAEDDVAAGRCEGAAMTVERNANTDEFELTLRKSAGCGGEDTQFRINSMPEAVKHGKVGPAGRLRGTPRIEDKAVPVGKYIRLSNPQFDNPKFGANEVAKIDVWPRHVDADEHEFLVQQDAENWVEYRIPEFYKLKGIDVYETLNPGGVYRIDLLTEKSVHIVYDSKGGKADKAFDTTATRVQAMDDGNPTGAQQLQLRFKTPSTEMQYLRIWVDASAKWRGIDAIMLRGLTKVYPEIPGKLIDGKVTFKPQRSHGCDIFRYSVHQTEWSDSSTVKICYGGPRGGNGRVCSGNGAAADGDCTCKTRAGGKDPLWRGDDCSVAACPHDGGKECGGRGRCGGPKDPQHNCLCDPAFTGRGCRYQRESANCYFVGDPHWGTFDKSATRDRTYYNMYFEGEFLDYGLNNADLNPDHEAIAHHQRKPWSHHFVTATTWVAFRKGKDFVKVISQGDIRIGRAGSTCYGNNQAAAIKALNGQGKPFVTPDGLSIWYKGNHWKVTSDVEGKNPSGTSLRVYGQWLYINSYIDIHTAKIGAAIGLCGNFDGKGNDLGNHWRYGEPQAAVSNALRVPASSSFDKCAQPNKPVVQTTLVSTLVSTQADDATVEADQQKWVTHGDSDHKMIAAIDQAEQIKNGKAASPHIRTEAGAEAGAQAGAQAGQETGEARRVAGMTLKDALTDCGGKTVPAATYPKLTEPLTRTHLALDSCWDNILSKTPAAEVSDELSTAAQVEVASAHKALQALTPFPQHTEKVNAYVSCVTDVCESGIVENWNEIEEVEAKLDSGDVEKDETAVLETERIEGRKL
jgi:hypothetical protein